MGARYDPTKTADRRLVAAWMRRNYLEHVDVKTGELNTTTLTEAAADDLDLYCDRLEYVVPEDWYEVAHEVEQALVKAGLVYDIDGNIGRKQNG
jgi:hypothetical protein